MIFAVDSLYFVFPILTDKCGNKNDEKIDIHLPVGNEHIQMAVHLSSRLRK